jgi:hypothetical protein
MPTRSEILDTLAASQEKVTAYFQGLSPEELKRPCTASGVPGEAAWRAKDHFAHLAENERNIQILLRLTLNGETSLPGNLGAMSREEQLAAHASPSLAADRTAGDLFAANAQHAAVHIMWIAEGFRQGL